MQISSSGCNRSNWIEWNELLDAAGLLLIENWQ
jgi:hypothetical protein